MIAITNGGSNRQYFRDGDHIHVVGTCKEENRAFITLARHFRALGFAVPEVYRVSEDEMEYDIEDLGDVSLFDLMKDPSVGFPHRATESEIKALLEKTLRALAHIQIEGDRGLDYQVCYPQARFNRRSVLWDLNYFKYCFLKVSGVEMLEEQLEDEFERMADRLLQTPIWGFMYRDFQSRNVMLTSHRAPSTVNRQPPSPLTPYFIDFQGGRKGPVLYDVASFLWQAKANYPQPLREELVEVYLDELQTLVEVDREAFKQDLQHFVLFRTLQVLGAYGYRGLIEKKAHFLESIPFALNNLEQLRPFIQAHYPYLNTLSLHRASSTVNRQSSTVNRQPSTSLTIDIYSFSYKKGIPSDVSDNGGGFVFDCRACHNPGKYDEYKQLTGLDMPVIQFIEQDGEMAPFLEAAYQLVDQSVKRYLERGFSHLMVSFGCTGGQHRSVYGAEQLAKHLKATFHPSPCTVNPQPSTPLTLHIHHRELNIHREV